MRAKGRALAKNAITAKHVKHRSLPGELCPGLDGGSLNCHPQDGRTVLVTHVAGQPRTLVERIEAAVYWLCRRLTRQAGDLAKQ